MSATSPGKPTCSTDASVSLWDPRMLRSRNLPWRRHDQESRELPPETRGVWSRVSRRRAQRAPGPPREKRDQRLVDRNVVPPCVRDAQGEPVEGDATLKHGRGWEENKTKHCWPLRGSTHTQKIFRIFRIFRIMIF